VGLCLRFSGIELRKNYATSVLKEIFVRIIQITRFLGFANIDVPAEVWNPRAPSGGA
jgi:hypothetical protein